MAETREEAVAQLEGLRERLVNRGLMVGVYTWKPERLWARVYMADDGGKPAVFWDPAHTPSWGIEWSAIEEGVIWFENFAACLEWLEARS